MITIKPIPATVNSFLKSSKEGINCKNRAVSYTLSGIKFVKSINRIKKEAVVYRKIKL